ncbi:unnamed protein product [Prunus armeniaca]
MAVPRRLLDPVMGQVGATVVRDGGATMSIAGSWVEWLWAVTDLAIAAGLLLRCLLPTLVVWKASME